MKNKTLLLFEKILVVISIFVTLIALFTDIPLIVSLFPIIILGVLRALIIILVLILDMTTKYTWID